jgi:SOS response regulatory protein OraA/RecX
VPENGRAHALEVAKRALARREYSERGLRERLARAGVEPEDADAAVVLLREASLLDDARFASQRARVLADRGRGDHAIRFDLESHGVDRELAGEALAALEPERERAARVVARRGPGPKTGRLLAQQGFDADVVEQALAGGVAPDR